METPRFPFKANAVRRHRIPWQRHRVTNWPAYEAGLRARGSLMARYAEESVDGIGKLFGEKASSAA